MAGICDGRVVVVTGAGRGLGREYALALAREGARVVVNDLGLSVDGNRPEERDAAARVADEIHRLGGEAIVNGDDVAEDAGARRIVESAIARFGTLDAVVNNAGILRANPFIGCTREEWDAVMRVHLAGHHGVAHWACRYWQSQQGCGVPVDARIINTSSCAGLQGSAGHAAYSAAKAAIAVLTLVQAAELGRYGITANAVAPNARTRMTETAYAAAMRKPEHGFDAVDPAHGAPIVVWLASRDSAGITGQVFEASGGVVRLSEGWTDGPSIDKGAAWAPGELGPVVRDLVARRTPAKPVYGA